VEIWETQSGQSMKVVEGVILMTDCEWSEQEAEVACSIVDSGTGARIHDNRKVPISPASDRSKNNAAITPVTQLGIEVFRADTGAAVGTARKAYDWIDCMRHALEYISDGTIGVVSDWYAALPDDQRIALAIGWEVRTGETYPRIEYTFEDLFTEVAKRYNLWRTSEVAPDGSVTVRIEPEAHFYSTTVGMVKTNQMGLVRSQDTDRMYATLKVGDSDAIKELATANPLPFVVLLGFTEETFHFQGVCNSDAELDLATKWHSDTNIINHVVRNLGDDYDDDILLIQYTESTSAATQGTYLNQGAAPYLYNEEMLNIRVVGRHDLPGGVGANYGVNFNADFQASYTQSVPGETSSWDMGYGGNFFYVWARARYDDDYSAGNFDPSNVWGNGTPQGQPVSLANSRFTAPGQGFFMFTCQNTWTIDATNPTFQAGGQPPHPSNYAWTNIGQRARVYDSGDVQIGGDHIASGQPRALVGLYVDTFTFGLSLQAGDYVEFDKAARVLDDRTPGQVGGPLTPTPPDASDYLPNNGVRVTIQPTKTEVRLLSSVAGGFINPPGITRTQKFEFERTMFLSEWAAITANPALAVEIDGARLTNFRSITRNIRDGMTRWELNKRP